MISSSTAFCSICRYALFRVDSSFIAIASNAINLAVKALIILLKTYEIDCDFLAVSLLLVRLILIESASKMGHKLQVDFTIIRLENAI